jgi:hypothetical protein
MVGTIEEVVGDGSTLQSSGTVRGVCNGRDHLGRIGLGVDQEAHVGLSTGYSMVLTMWDTSDGVDFLEEHYENSLRSGVRGTDILNSAPRVSGTYQVRYRKTGFIHQFWNQNNYLVPKSCSNAYCTSIYNPLFPNIYI